MHSYFLYYFIHILNLNNKMNLGLNEQQRGLLLDILQKSEVFSRTYKVVVAQIISKLKDDEYFKFETVEDAEKYYEEEINSNSNNMNPEFENARDAWVSDNADDIRECYEENNKK